MKSNYPIASVGSYVRQVSKRNKDEANIEVFSVTNSEGFTRSINYFSKEVFSKDVSNYKLVKRGQFAYNPSRINVGSIDYLKSIEAVLVSPLYIVFETVAELYPDYLLRYMKSNWGNAQIRSNTEGAVRDSLKYKGLENIKIPLPPLADQKRIAHLLGKVEGLIARRKQHLQQLDDLLKSIFLEMFGDPVQNEKGWATIPLKKGCEEIYRYPTFYGFAYSNEGVPVVRIGNILMNGNIDPNISNYVFITQDISEKYPRTILKFNDILMAVRGDGSTGKRIGIINSNNLVGANMSPNLLRMSCNKNIFNPIFFFHFLTSERGQIFISRNITRTAKKTITAENLKAISIPHPPIDLQNQFAAIVEKVEGLKSRYQQSLTDLEQLYGALSQKAFKGELDLSRVPLPVDEVMEALNVEKYEIGIAL